MDPWKWSIAARRNPATENGKAYASTPSSRNEQPSLRLVVAYFEGARDGEEARDRIRAATPCGWAPRDLTQGEYGAIGVERLGTRLFAEPAACREVNQRLLEFRDGGGGDFFAALVTTGPALDPIHPAAAAMVAGQFRRSARVDEDHRQAPRKARPSDSRKSS